MLVKVAAKRVVPTGACRRRVISTVARVSAKAVRVAPALGSTDRAITGPAVARTSVMLPFLRHRVVVTGRLGVFLTESRSVRTAMLLAGAVEAVPVPLPVPRRKRAAVDISPQRADRPSCQDNAGFDVRRAV